MTGQDLPQAAAAAVAQIARDLGAQVLPEGSDPAQLLAPAAALRIARQVELAARAQVGVHIRRSREDGPVLARDRRTAGLRPAGGR